MADRLTRLHHLCIQMTQIKGVARRAP